MRKIKINHFGGKALCTTWDEVAQTLEQTVDGVNEFFVVAEHTMFPHLHILVKGDYAVVDCVPNETDAGLMAFSDDTPTDLPPDGNSNFITFLQTYSSSHSTQLDISPVSTKSFTTVQARVLGMT